VIFIISYPFFITAVVFHFKLINYIHMMEEEIRRHRKDGNDDFRGD